MRWQGQRESGNVEDRRGSRAVRRGGIGLLLLALVGSFLFDIDPETTMDIGNAILGNDEQTEETGKPVEEDAKEQQLRRFVSVVLADLEDTWHTIFKANNLTYEEPKLVLFREDVNTKCGIGQADIGPFYCPADKKVYLDLSFYEELKRDLGAPGDFAQAYVLAHEVGHHVQKLLGASDEVDRQSEKLSEVESNRLSVRLELQADCYAGIWAHYADRTRHLVEPGDIEEALNAASKIGDDHLQRSAGYEVTPDTFTHGTSAQRVRWFKRGYKSGDPSQCNTFGAEKL